ncbi:hypothetical protein EU537_04940, partial [Candidatus Thorarchaeota archaeon]
GIAVENGYVYVTGYTSSTGFPVVNAYDATHDTNSDCFVTKLATDGQSLVYSTFLGGGDTERGGGIAVENGYVYVIGDTWSTNFPVVNAYDATHNGGPDCFVTKLATDGQSLVYSTFLGGSSSDLGYGIAVENGYVYVTGYTSSTGFPVVNAYDATHNGISDCFVTILAEDSDSDGLSNWDEDFIHGTDPRNIDTDNDNYHDGYEVEMGTDSLDPEHYPGMHHDLQYSSYLGGSLDDMGYDIAVEDSFIYITGKTHSGNFPTVNAIDGTHNGMGDAYVLKLTEDGNSIVYSTFIGGSDNELGNAIAVNDGWVWVTGYTYSTDFPTVNAYDATHNDDRDCFVLRLTPSGTSLWFSTFLGGSGDDFGEDVAVWNNLTYVTGSTTSAGYPVTTGAFDESHNGQQDAFVTKISSDGSTLVYSTFLGGTQNDYGHGIAVEDAYAYITGTTVSAFPLNNPYDGTHDVGYDGFVSKISLDGTSLIFSTYIGAESYDNPQDIAVEDGNAYIVGITGSLLFPTVHAYCSSHHGDTRDVFVTKFAADGQSLDYSTFLGGTGADYGLAISVENGYAGVTGYTNSTDYPTTFNQPSGDGDECFITMLSKHGQSIIYSTVLGGEGDDRGQGIAVHDGTMYATGLTRSNHFPTHIPFDSSYNGNWDAFVAVIGLDSDRDGVCDSWENMLGTDPNWIDTDNDNFLDYYEFVYGSNATDPEDYPAMPQVWYEAIYNDLDGNSTLIQQIKDWLDGNHTAIETLFTYVEGNATLLLDTVDALEGNATELAVVAALATANYDWLEQLNATAITNLTEIREVLNQLGASVGDADYDGLDDIDELEHGTDLQCIDTDCDNLNDAYEIKIGTDPLDDDSDGDSYLDGAEILSGTDPLDPNSYPGSSTDTDTTTTTAPPPDESSPLMIMVIVMGAGIGVVVIVAIFLIRRRRAAG